MNQLGHRELQAIGSGSAVLVRFVRALPAGPRWIQDHAFPSPPLRHGEDGDGGRVRADIGESRLSLRRRQPQGEHGYHWAELVAHPARFDRVRRLTHHLEVRLSLKHGREPGTIDELTVRQENSDLAV